MSSAAHSQSCLAFPSFSFSTLNFRTLPSFRVTSRHRDATSPLSSVFPQTAGCRLQAFPFSVYPSLCLPYLIFRFVSIPCALFSLTAPPQIHCFQSATHSFPSDGGVYPFTPSNTRGLRHTTLYAPLAEKKRTATPNGDNTGALYSLSS